jgi:hypothetical protein
MRLLVALEATARFYFRNQSAWSLAARNARHQPYQVLIGFSLVDIRRAQAIKKTLSVLGTFISHTNIATLAVKRLQQLRRPTDSAPQPNLRRAQMSGAEAGLVLGLVSAVITICEAAHEIWEAVEDQSGLTVGLRRAAEELPLAATSLEQAKVNLNAALRAGTISEDSNSAIEQSLRSCKESADYVRQTFREYLPTKDDHRKTRISKAYTLRRRSKKIQEHVRHIMRGIETLAQHQVLHDAQILEDIKAAIEELELSDNDEGKSQITESGDINNLSGNATLRKNVNSSSGKQYVSTESSVQHIAENMYMGKGTE